MKKSTHRRHRSRAHRAHKMSAYASAAKAMVSAGTRKMSPKEVKKAARALVGASSSGANLVAKLYASYYARAHKRSKTRRSR